MSDHYHYEYAEARHDHRGDYADSRHDHDIDYAEKHHRHYDLETDDATTRQGIADLRAEVAELREDLRDAFARIQALEQQAPDARQAELEADAANAGADWSQPEENIVRTYTHPDVFTVGVEQGWAEAETDPARIDWPERQARAAIPFRVAGGRPVNPCQKTGVRFGRNEMGFWGEQLMADALVTVTWCGVRSLLMIERGDGHGWAVPGGHVEPGETGLQAAVRELAEETGLSPDSAAWAVPPCRIMAARYVPDPRASDEAWAVTIPVHIDLGEVGVLPVVQGGDDARLACWLAAESYPALAWELDRLYGGRVFAAHVDMLREFLGDQP